mgnify:CR=1 FL=1
MIHFAGVKTKYLAASLLILVTATLAYCGLVGFLTRETRNWDFIQAVGGMKVSVQESTLLVDCDVSGLRKVTVKPTVVNSGIGVHQLKLKRDRKTIYVTVVTSLIRKGIKTSPKPVDISHYPAGEYTVQYLDRDGTKHPVGKIRVEAKKAETADDSEPQAESAR